MIEETMPGVMVALLLVREVVLITVTPLVMTLVIAIVRVRAPTPVRRLVQQRVKIPVQKVAMEPVLTLAVVGG